MDWQIKTAARCSTLSGTEFVEGDRVVSIIFMDPGSGDLARADLLEGEVEAFAPGSAVLGRWSRTFKIKADAEADSRRQQAQSAEEFFMSLFETADDPQTSETAALKHMLGLLLERRRVLRQVGKRSAAGEQAYLHVKSKRSYDVPVMDIPPELMLTIRDLLGEILD